MRKFISYFFLIVSFGEIASILLSIDFLHILCKPLIMVTLGMLYFYSVPKENRSGSLILAIVFSFAGDVLLMLPPNKYFIAGLFAFLVSHLFYLMTYRQHRNENSNHALEGVQRVRFAFPIILAGTGLIVVLYPALGNLKLPVVIYAVILILMVLNSLFRYGYTNNKSFWLVFTGAILFLISDSVLAINKFLQPVQNGILIIMITYIMAQYLIVTGLIHHTRKM